MRHPIDAVGIWYAHQPFLSRYALALIALPLVFGWYFLYQLRRHIHGPVDDL
jgi:hypothetical protein